MNSQLLYLSSHSVEAVGVAMLIIQAKTCPWPSFSIWSCVTEMLQKPNTQHYVLLGALHTPQEQGNFQIKFRQAVNKTVTAPYQLSLSLARATATSYSFGSPPLPLLKVYTQIVKDNETVVKEWVIYIAGMNPAALEISCMNTSAVLRKLCACFTVRSRSELWQQTTDILPLWFNVELIFQNQGLTLSMLQVKQKEYFIKDPNQLIDSLLLKIFFLLKQNKIKRTRKTKKKSEYHKSWNSRLVDHTELKN